MRPDAEVGDARRAGRAEPPSTIMGPRESMRALPGFLQPALTWLTGRPLPEEPPWSLRPTHHLWACVAPIVAGVTLGAAVVGAGWWMLLLPLSWLLTTHGMRKARVMIVHQCSHGNFLRDKAVDARIAQLISLVLVSQEYREYKHEHVADHHSRNHMTLLDPTVQYLLVVLGMRAGMTRRQLWRRLWLSVLAPRLQLKATYGRLMSHFRRTTIRYRAVLIGLLAAQAAAVTVLDAWPTFLLVWVFPLTVLFNAAATIRLSSRHLFPPNGPVTPGRSTVAGYTHGVFFGERTPDPTLPRARRMWHWGRWWLRMLFVHLPARLFVFVGDGPCHDYHHRFPRSRDWANYIFARERDIADGHPGWPPYTEVWGLFDAIDAVFVSLSAADPVRYDLSRLTSVNQGELLAAFEE